MAIRNRPKYTCHVTSFYGQMIRIQLFQKFFLPIKNKTIGIFFAVKICFITWWISVSKIIWKYGLLSPFLWRFKTLIIFLTFLLSTLATLTLNEKLPNWSSYPLMLNRFYVHKTSQSFFFTHNIYVFCKETT